MNNTNESYEKINNGGVSEMVEGIINKCNNDYLLLLNKYKDTSKTNKLNGKFVSNRPWIKISEDGVISLNLEYLKHGLNIEKTQSIIEEVILKANASDNSKFKFPAALKAIESEMFDSILNTQASIKNEDGNFMVSINNGEIHLMVRGLSSVRTKSITPVGNKIHGESTTIVKEMQRNFNGIIIKLTHTNTLPFRVNIDEASKEKSIEELEKKFSTMSAVVKQMWLIVVARFIKLASEDRLENGVAYISMEDIYFNYKGGAGSGEYGTSVPLKVKQDYMKAFKELEKYTVDIDYSNISTRLSRYMNITNSKNKKIVNNSSLFKIIDTVEDKTIKKSDDGKVLDSDNTNVIGFTYQLGEIGKLYIQDLSMTTLNNRYSKSLLGLNTSNHKVAINIGDYLEYQHRLKLYKSNKEIKISLSKLIEIADMDFNFGRPKRSMESLINQFNIAVEILKKDGLISKVDIPPNIYTVKKRNFDYVFITVEFKYSTEEKNKPIPESEVDVIDENGNDIMDI